MRRLSQWQLADDPAPGLHSYEPSCSHAAADCGPDSGAFPPADTNAVFGPDPRAVISSNSSSIVGAHSHAHRDIFAHILAYALFATCVDGCSYIQSRASHSCCIGCERSGELCHYLVCWFCSRQCREWCIGGRNFRWRQQWGGSRTACVPVSVTLHSRFP